MINKHTALTIVLLTALAAGSATVSAAPAAPTTLTPAGQKIEASLASQLASLKTELSTSVPAVDEAKKSALLASREAVKKAKAEAAAAQQPLDKIEEVCRYS